MKATVFDNGGRTYDRYTIVCETGEIHGASEDPFHPQGFGQYCGDVTAPLGSVQSYIQEAKDTPSWLGIEIKDHSTLPINVQKFITQSSN